MVLFGICPLGDDFFLSGVLKEFSVGDQRAI